MYLSNFYSVQPPYPKRQSESLEWLVSVYKAAQNKQSYSEEDYKKILNKVACAEPQIEYRKFFIPDAQSTDWEKHSIYPLHKNPLGVNMQTRQEYFHNAVNEIFKDIYKKREFPDDIIHVSCTGYVSPSAAQKVAVVADKPVTVTHSYHMGCYGAFPALRMASGFLANSQILGEKQAVDLVHTELCSLHMNPQDPSLEQMVIQSLFADGAIAYSMTHQKPQKGFKVLSLYEELVPNTAGAMEWMVADYGMKMTLSKDVPMLVGQKIREFTLRWLSSRKLDVSKILKNAVFAVHPGGPKIIDQVALQLELSDSQVQGSRQILKERGNMSSATLPHLWEKIIDDDSIKPGTPIVSYAFGPGLTICAGLMEKV